ncbi:hypothetical protein niasHT_014124 [Heterodera trifolii]|uniref:Uncharacterized protein n=1 Tax=Heterodera trifolii TaxID=157864 RepID=A0ABD2LJN4_9BILA
MGSMQSGDGTFGQRGGFGALDQYYAKKARLVFAKGSGQDFLRNIIDLSQWMTADEVRECAEKFKWICGLSAKETKDIKANGSGKASSLPVRRRKYQSDDATNERDNDAYSDDNSYHDERSYDNAHDDEEEYYGSASEQDDDNENGSDNADGNDSAF